MHVFKPFENPKTVDFIFVYSSLFHRLTCLTLTVTVVYIASHSAFLTGYYVVPSTVTHGLHSS